MGSSFTDYNGYGFWSRDSALEEWLFLLSEKIRAQPTAEPWPRDLGEHWFIQSSVGFMGCINAGLDDYVTDDGRKQTVITLCESVMNDLERGEPVISEESLNAVITSYRRLDFTPPELFIKHGSVFIALLQGKVTTTPATSPCGWGNPTKYIESLDRTARGLPDTP